MADYIEVTDLGLTPATTYYYKFQWKYADGTTSEFSAVKSVTTAGDLKAQAPTLATGLTADTASFGITISWDGTYASSAFTGFKSVNIYASTTNLGSSTTTNLTANLVGSMTVDQQKNKITIGSTLLKNTLSLTSTTVYTTPIYFYFITVNSNNEVYKSGGVATYTRINSTGINPTQANKIDLEAGTISIENLVAGNGQFTEYLRAGYYNGARIELSGSSVNINSTSGGTVLPGLSIYNSSGNPVLRAPLGGNLEITDALFKINSGSGTDYGQLTINTNALGSPQISWGPTASPYGRIYQFAGGNGMIIENNGNDSDGYLYLIATGQIQMASETQFSYSIIAPSGASSWGVGSNRAHRNIYAVATTLPSASSYSDGDIVVIY